MINIIKRDGTIQGFTMAKVDNAVRKAFKAVAKQDEELDVPDKFLEQLHASINALIAKKTSVGELISVENKSEFISTPTGISV